MKALQVLVCLLLLGGPMPGHSSPNGLTQGGVFGQAVDLAKSGGEAAGGTISDTWKKTSAAASDGAKSTVGTVTKGAQQGAAGVQQGLTTLGSNVDKFGRSLDQVGAIIDEGKAALADPEGVIRTAVTNSVQGIIMKALGDALDYKNVCDTKAVKAAFEAGGWERAYYGRRVWDSKVAATTAALIFPATSAAAAEELMAELRAQYASVTSMIEKAAKDLGDDLQALLERMIRDMLASASSGAVIVPNIERDTFGIKGSILRVSCSSQAAGIRLPAEGNFQLAFAFRIKQPTYRNVATVPTGNVDPAVTQAVGAAANGGSGSFGGGNFAGAGAQQQPTINSVVGAYINQAVQCACRNSFRNPRTGALIPCACYYWNQQAGSSCPGAMFGQGSQLWYRNC